MSLTRRLFTRAAVAAPAAGKLALAQATLGGTGVGVGLAAHAAGSALAAPISGTSSGGIIAKAIKLGLVSKDEAFSAYMRNSWTGSLDPDLVANVSMSLDTKFRLQKRRNAERQMRADIDDRFDIYTLADRLRGSVS